MRRAIKASTSTLDSSLLDNPNPNIYIYIYIYMCVYGILVFRQGFGEIETVGAAKRQSPLPSQDEHEKEETTNH